ncbi:MAG: iron ABC transporter permease [Candidatus Methanomethylophilaceae archaeon]|jgi:iron complex transport system permease protein|nr:iron ABC transporter permease [Candidatus Methanomethylophilaceae archaeon]
MTFYKDTSQDPMVSTKIIDLVDTWDQGVDNADVEFKDTLKQYNRLIKLKFLFIAICIAVIVIVAGYSISLGAYDISFLDTYDYLWRHITGAITDSADDMAKDRIIWEYRLPRILFAIAGGAALAVVGAVMQSILKNPLADSYTTGVSSGAGFGAAFAISLGLTMGNSWILIMFAFCFALIPTMVIIAVSRLSTASPTTMIMAGIGVMYIFNAATSVLMLWSDPNAMKDIYAWQIGSLSNKGVTIDNVPLVVICSIVGILILWLSSGKINVLATGDESSKALGIDADKLRLILLLISGVLASAIVSFVGLVGFVGLVTPHICRIFIGADNKYLIPASAITGGMIMLCADQIGRSLMSTPLPVGVVMAFIGGPVFLWLILRRSEKVW